MLNFYKRFGELLSDLILNRRLRKYVKRFIFRSCIMLKGYGNYYYKIINYSKIVFVKILNCNAQIIKYYN